MIKHQEKILDLLKDHALKIVANAHSEMTDEQFGDYVNELTEVYASQVIGVLKELMTGEEWYERFDRIYHKLLGEEHQGTKELSIGQIAHEAAKRAAGVKEE